MNTKHRSPRQRPATAGKKADQIARITLVRRIKTGIDIGDHKVEFELEIETLRGVKERLFEAPSDMLSPPKLIKQIVDKTGYFPANWDALVEQIEAVRLADAPTLTRTVTSGWRGKETNRLQRFVLPGRTIAPGRKKLFTQPLLLTTTPATEVAFRRRGGSLKAWQRENLCFLGYSSLGVASLGAAMAAALLPLSSLPESMMIFISGESSGGKTAIQLGAMSFQGAGVEQAIISPNVSERALQELGANYNHLLLSIDDLGKRKESERREFIRSLIYETVGGGGRTVSAFAQRQSGLRTLQFQTIVLASSEKSSVEIAEAAGDEQLIGERVRLFDLLAAPASEGGVFDMMSKADRRGGGELAEALRKAAGANYGYAHKAWIKWLIDQTEVRTRRRVEQLTVEFTELARQKLVADLSVGANRRTAQKFGLIYAALRLGRDAGVIDWPKNLVQLALLNCLGRALKASGSEPVDQLVGRFKAMLADPADCPD